MLVEELEGDLDLGRCDDMPGAGQDGDLAVGQLPVGGDPVVECAVGVAIADEDEGRCGDFRESSNVYPEGRNCPRPLPA